MTDRRGTATAMTYASDGTSAVATANGSQTMTWTAIDGSGRVGRQQESANGTLYHDATFTWDTNGSTCRQPDPVVDNNLCSLSGVQTATAAGAAPTSTTTHTYIDDGYPAVERRTNPAGGTDVTTNGYHVQQVGADGQDRTYDDAITGGGTVASGAPREDTPALTLFTVDDHVGALPPRGNTAGTGYQPYMTTWTPDALATASPGARNTGACSANGLATGNSGLLCEKDAPASDANLTTADGRHDPTRYTYDQFGQRATMTTAKALADSGSAANPYRYYYYGDTDTDLSGLTRAGGWLKAVADPTAVILNGEARDHFTAFAYDRAGNPVRTWDRGATTRASVTTATPVSSYPGTTTAPPSPDYTETLFAVGTPGAAVANPWRYVRSTRDPVGNVTRIGTDSNGNPLTTTPPRGVLAGDATFDMTRTFSADDLQLTEKKPVESSAATTTIDAYGNVVAATDPRGDTTAFTYDGVNRRTANRWTRGPWPGGTAPVSDCLPGTQTTSSDAPLPAGRILCASGTAYDGHDNVLQEQDAAGATYNRSYDSKDRKVQELVSRDAITSKRTDWVFDADNEPVRTCPPREFDPVDGASTSCAAGGYYSTAMAYDPAGRITSATNYRVAPGTHSGAPATPVGLVTQYTNDADGNLITTKDPNGNTSTGLFDVLDRQVRTTSPRAPGVTEVSNTVYDAAGNATGIDAPGSNATRQLAAMTYDADNRLVDSISAASSTDATQVGVAAADGGSNLRTRRYYDADGNTVAQLPARAFSASVASPDLHLLQATDLDRDGRTTAEYTPRDSGAASTVDDGTQGRDCTTTNRPAPVQAPVGAPVPGYPADTLVCVTRTAYDANGNIATLRLANSNGTDNRFSSYGYSDDNLQISRDDPAPTTAGTGVTTGTTGPRVQTTLRYDGASRLTARKDALGRTTTYQWNLDGTLARTAQPPTGPQGAQVTHAITYTYDLESHQRNITDALNHSSTSLRNSDGSRAALRDAANNTTSYAYDMNGNVTGVTRPNLQGRTGPNGPLTDAYSYTQDNLLLARTTPTAWDGNRSRRVDYTLDDAGRRTATHTYEVDAAGNPISGRDGGTQLLAYYTDGLVRTETGRGTNPPTVTRTYDPDGNPTVVTDTTSGGSTITSSYYLDGLLRSADDGTTATGGHTTQHAYDGTGNRTGTREDTDGVAPGTPTRYTYNDAQMLLTATNTQIGNVSQNNDYDAVGRLASHTDANGLTSTSTYDEDDNLVTKTVARTGATVAAYSYTYDAVQRVTVQSLAGLPAAGTSTGQDNRKLSYTYDSADHLNGYSQQDGATTTTVPVNHDGDGNRTAYGATAYTYNADDSLATRNDGGTTRPVAYTPVGQIGNDGCATYGYDPLDRTNSRSTTGAPGCPASGSATYAYDGLDRQRSHTDTPAGMPLPQLPVGVHRDGLDQQIVSSATVTGTGTTYQPAPDGRGTPTALRSGTGTQVLTTDGRGNVGYVTGATADVACTARYDPYGAPSTGGSNACSTGTTPSDIFYGSQRRDATSGNYQLGSRTYDPGLATYTSADGYRSGSSAADGSVGVDPQSQNTYGYVNGDPVNLVDHNGHMADPVKGDAPPQVSKEQFQHDTGRDCANSLYCNFFDFQNNTGYVGKQAFIQGLYDNYGGVGAFNTNRWFDNILGVIAFEKKNDLFRGNGWWSIVNSSIIDGISGGHGFKGKRTGQATHGAELGNGPLERFSHAPSRRAKDR